jgi:hypothetical protein
MTALRVSLCCDWNGRKCDQGRHIAGLGRFAVCVYSAQSQDGPQIAPVVQWQESPQPHELLHAQLSLLGAQAQG